MKTQTERIIDALDKFIAEVNTAANAVFYEYTDLQSLADDLAELRKEYRDDDE